MKQVLGTVAFLGLSLLVLPGGASAQCTQTDINFQANINGSSTPAAQSNQVDMSANGPCSSTSIHTQGVQINTGGRSPVIQKRTVTQTITPGRGNGTGVDVPVVPVRATVQVDVYNAAD
ncbi:MAG: hypothetical protein HLUCCA11_22045 [Phormidesmis priestleyi Ana]|uniref:Uncharacterized protein n=1 Tax=Phormidesmis priestleyi Ana TaxID=1666911 RepID=A0A0N8KLY1_9CYAN|nr:MAG: hypothetical protein HLUCCA11_22045 [Phormidesmis priestleyi Ana]